MHDAFTRLIEAAERRAKELRDSLPYVDDRGVTVIESQITNWEKLARDGREALHIGMRS